MLYESMNEPARIVRIIARDSNLSGIIGITVIGRHFSQDFSTGFSLTPGAKMPPA
jgi:hypothetical protein